MFNNPFRKNDAIEKADNAQDAKKNIIEALINRFKQLRFDDSSLSIKQVTIWAADPVYISLLKNDAFVNQLHREIENNFIDSLRGAEITVRMGKPAAKIQPGCLIEDAVWFSFPKESESQATSKKIARVTVSNNCGSLKRKSYDLDTEQHNVFHIGRGLRERNKNRPYRENHIVIDDEERNQDIMDLNSHVSGSHADIIFDEGTYYLRATPYGCRPDGSKTSVIRETKDGTVEYEIKDSESRFHLQSGDLIELGGAVVLSFMLTKK